MAVPISHTTPAAARHDGQPRGHRATPHAGDATWTERLAVLGGVLGIVAVGTVLGSLYAPEATRELMGLVPLSFFVAGKFLPLWGLNPGSSLSPWHLGLVIWAMDTCTVIVTVYAIEAFYRIKLLKRAILKVQSNARLVLTAYPRIKRTAVVGVVCFVLFPVAGTGALAGSFLGVLLGLHRFVLIAAVSMGGLLGGMLMAFLAVYFGGAVTAIRHMQQHPAVQYSLIAAMFVIAVLALRQLSRAYKRALDVAAAEQTARE